MKDRITYSRVEHIKLMGEVSFFEKFVKSETPVVFSNVTSEWKAIELWTPEYMLKFCEERFFPIKMGDVSKGNKSYMNLSEYFNVLHEYQVDTKKNCKVKSPPPYLHDVPIFHLIPDLIKDVFPFPSKLLMHWYRPQWWQFAQFFIGGENSLTPLHFDTLYTHNLFFQIVGEKTFYLMPQDNHSTDFFKSWRWSILDLENPDLDMFPSLKNARILKVTLRPGDVLFIPSGMLHQVRGHTFSISFNIDWHTRKSVVKGLLSAFEGAPLPNIFYNFIVFLGLFLRVPSKYLFTYYKSYLNYTS